MSELQTREMMLEKQEDTPWRLEWRPKDDRGYIIPYTQHIVDGVPDFRTLDAERVARCLTNKLCAMCGAPLGVHLYFIGGPRCLKHGMFYDPAMHQDCAKYALRVCPHLSRSKGRYAEPPLSTPETKIVHGAVDPEKVGYSFLMHTKGFTVRRDPRNDMIAIFAKLPWLDFSLWMNGVRLLGPVQTRR
jgi:hypothetical protein